MAEAPPDVQRRPSLIFKVFDKLDDAFKIHPSHRQPSVQIGGESDNKDKEKIAEVKKHVRQIQADIESYGQLSTIIPHIDRLAQCVGLFKTEEVKLSLVGSVPLSKLHLCKVKLEVKQTVPELGGKPEGSTTLYHGHIYLNRLVWDWIETLDPHAEFSGQPTWRRSNQPDLAFVQNYFGSIATPPKAISSINTPYADQLPGLIIDDIAVYLRLKWKELTSLPVRAYDIVLNYIRAKPVKLSVKHNLPALFGRALPDCSTTVYHGHVDGDLVVWDFLETLDPDAKHTTEQSIWSRWGQNERFQREYFGVNEHPPTRVSDLVSNRISDLIFLGLTDDMSPNFFE